MEWLVTMSEDVVQVAVNGLVPLSVWALQPESEVPPSLKFTLPVGVPARRGHGDGRGEGDRAAARARILRRDESGGGRTGVDGLRDPGRGRADEVAVAVAVDGGDRVGCRRRR